MAQTGNAADALTTIAAWPHPWFRESSWLVVMAVRFLGSWGGVVAAKLLWALILWGLTIAAARYVQGVGRHRSVGWGIVAGLAGLGVLLWLAAITNALALVQHAGRQT